MGAKSDMNSAKLVMADDDGDESRETISLAVLVRRSLVKCLVALILFFFLLVGAAWTVHVYERPLEEVAQAADAAERARYAEMIQRLFKLYDVPADRGLSGDSVRRRVRKLPHSRVRRRRRHLPRAGGHLPGRHRRLRGVAPGVG